MNREPDPLVLQFPTVLDGAGCEVHRCGHGVIRSGGAWMQTL